MFELSGLSKLLINDLINAFFEFGGAVVVWMNVFKLHKDKKIMGVFWPVWVFYSVWGMWNLYYYPTLQQHWSFWAGLLLVIGNTFWVCQAVYYQIILPRRR